MAAGDREIVWLYTTTTASSWERFVAAVQRAGRRLQIDHPGVQALVGDAAFPKQTTAVPEVALALPAGAGRLVFRWYKITTDWKTRDWVRRCSAPAAAAGDHRRQLQRRRPASWPGSSAASRPGLPEQDRPLLLLTTATADRVTDPDAPGAAEAREIGPHPRLSGSHVPLLFLQQADGHRRHAASCGPRTTFVPTPTPFTWSSGTTIPTRTT